MTNSLLTTDRILTEALMHLENEMVMPKLVSRDYEAEYEKPQKAGASIRIRKPVRGQVRTGNVRSVQDVEEGNTTLTVSTLVGADLDFTNVDMTLSVEKFSDRYLRPQMSLIANNIDLAIHAELYQHCPNWVGTAGQTIDAYRDYTYGPQRLDELAVPMGDRSGVLAPSDYWSTVSSVTSLSADAPVTSMLRKASLGRYANTDTYMSQNVKAHTVGSWAADSVQVNGANQNVTWASAKSTAYTSQTLLVKNMTASATIKKGDIFTIAGVLAVNPITGDNLDFARQFCVISDDTTADGSGLATITITPAIITSGPYKTCSEAPTDSDAITVKGTSGTSYKQNLVFHRDAVTLAIVPLEIPRGAVSCVQKSYKGITMRLIEGYDMTNNISGWRFDVLYGVLAHQPHLATRISGT
jgi:hypothetical protein